MYLQASEGISINLTDLSSNYNKSELNLKCKIGNKIASTVKHNFIYSSLKVKYAKIRHSYSIRILFFINYIYIGS